MSVWKTAAEKLKAEAEAAKAELEATREEAARIMEAARQVEAQASAKIAAAQEELHQIRDERINEDQKLQRARADYQKLCEHVQAIAEG
jgi:uncharacterized protein (DUF3084 family)